MSQVKRKFKEDEKVYVVDYWGTSNGAAAFAAGAIVVSVNEEKELVGLVLYGDTYQIYSFADYGRLIFDTAIEANKAASRLPSPGDIVYQKIGERVYKEQVDSIGGYVDDVYDLKIYFKSGRNASTKKMEVTIFNDEATARNKK